jgi:hypothetical protein
MCLKDVSSSFWQALPCGGAPPPRRRVLPHGRGGALSTTLFRGLGLGFRV